MRRRVIGVVAAVVLAAVGTAILLTWVQAAEERALAGERTVNVLVVRQEVPEGTPAEQLAASVETELVPAKVQAAGSVSSLEELSGLVTTVALLPGEQVVAGRFATVEEIQAQSALQVPDGLLEVTLSLDPARAVGGVLRPGDTVAILASFDPFETDGAAPGEDGEQPQGGVNRTPNTTHLILHKVLVTNVQAEQLPTGPETPDGEDPRSVQLAPTGNLLVTLALDAPSIERVVFAAEFGRIWLSIEDPESPEGGTRIQTRGTVYE